MTDFDVDPLKVLRVGSGLRDDSTKLDQPGADLPEADGGVMTPVIENAIGALLSNAELTAQAMVTMADSVENSALEYHAADTRAREEMARLMMPGASDAEITEAVERAQRAEEVGLGLLLTQGMPEAQADLMNAPSEFVAAQERADQRAEDSFDNSFGHLLNEPQAPEGYTLVTPDPEGGLEELLLGPLEDEE